MSALLNPSKATIIVMLGNILEYYDFLLFAHLGFIITPLFFPNYSAVQTHILSLVLFGLPFIARPLGGFIFGKMSDTKGRKVALIQAVRWAVFPAVGLAFLPSFASIGVTASYIFVLLRLFQGIAVGGEYPIAGTYLMEMHEKNQGLFSSILVAVGSIGSLAGIGFAVLCAKEDAPSWLWRAAFFIGALGSIISYYMRKHLGEVYIPQELQEKKEIGNLSTKRFLVFIFSILGGTTMWIPATYSNFYVTKILNYPVSMGLYASFVALVSYVILLPFFGMLYDRVSSRKYLLYATLLICFTSIFSFYLLTKSFITYAQIGLSIAPALVGAPQHKLMNALFPKAVRGRNVAFIFMAGLSFGGMFPSLAGYLVEKTRIDLMPAFLISIISLFTCFCFYKLFNDKELQS
jgi:MHS family proline/betaine transporter-like MFS transporter